jgi:hypothetical protein
MGVGKSPLFLTKATSYTLTNGRVTKMSAGKFRIKVLQRFYLIFVPLLLIVLLTIKIWVLLLHLWNPSQWDAVFVLLVVGLIVLAVIHLLHWFSFAVELSDQGINISDALLRWEDLESVHTKTASYFGSFSTLIELRSRDGRSYPIPACIQRSLFLLREIQRHLPDNKKE